MSHERWLPVPEYEGWYEVSDLGRTRSLDRVVGARMLRGKLLRPILNRETGYVYVCLRREGIRRNKYVHRLVLWAFVGPPPPGHEACHGPGARKDDNRLVNLRWDTPRENARDCVRDGRNVYALRERCPRGHPLVEPNLVPSMLRRGKRSCLACNKAAGNIWHARRSGRPVPDLQELSDAKYVRIVEAAM